MSDSGDYVLALDEKDLQEGKMKLLSIEGIPMLFIKLDGKLYIFDNRCPHMGCGFSGGVLDTEGKCVTCPCHDWCFDLESGEYKKDPEFKLHFFEWKKEGTKIWVKLED